MSAAVSSRQISWERTAQDFLAQLYTHPDLRPLSEFQHVVVRFGVTGAIHNYRVGKDRPYRRVHRLYFDPTAPKHGIFRDAAEDGDLIGHNSIFVASIVQELAQYVDSDNRHNEYAIAETIGNGIRNAIVRTQKHFVGGFSVEGQTQQAVELFFQKRFCTGVFDESQSGSSVAKDRRSIGDERIPGGNLSWSILNQSARYRLVEVAHDIVCKGVEKALNIRSDREGMDTVWAPVVIFKSRSDQTKRIELVDRREIESYRSVHNMLRKAEKESQRDRPLCIAVFGPPGSGKSYSIRVLAESAGFKSNAIRKVNLASRDAAKELTDAIEWAKTTQWTETPLLFLDEFDCRHEDQDLGWLKYFLSMMEEWQPGKPPEGGHEKPKPPPVLVFAGGTSYTFRDFSRSGVGGEEEQLKFALAKGPDFVSRLSGHIDIIGPNPTDEYDQAYVIRRALILRQILREKLGQETCDYSTLFQAELIRAMLTVSTYKHGSRSMRTIVNMCVRFGGEDGKYVPTSLAPAHQLDMHVDGTEFLWRVEEARKELKAELSRKVAQESREGVNSFQGRLRKATTPAARAEVWHEAQSTLSNDEKIQLARGVTGKQVESIDAANMAMDEFIQPDGIGEVPEGKPSPPDDQRTTATPRKKAGRQP